MIFCNRQAQVGRFMALMIPPGRPLAMSSSDQQRTRKYSPYSRGDRLWKIDYTKAGSRDMADEIGTCQGILSTTVVGLRIETLAADPVMIVIIVQVFNDFSYVSQLAVCSVETLEFI